MIERIKNYFHLRKKTTLPPVEVQELLTVLVQQQGWGVKQLNIPELWKITQGEGVTIGVIDTGVPRHDDLDENVLEGINCIPGEDQYDNHGHQTHCVGIIVAENNDTGMVGVAPKAKCLCIKGLSNRGSGTYGGLIKALEYCLEMRHDGTRRVDIVSMSLGGSSPSPQMEEVINKLTDAGIPVICAAGNDGMGGVNYPAAYDNSIAVAAYDSTGRVAGFSSKGPEVDFAKPGVNIYSTYLNNRYAKLSGTSMACPFMAGVVALLISRFRDKGEDYTVDKIKKLLIAESDDKGVTGKDDSWGYGVVDVYELITGEKGDPPTVTPTPSVTPKPTVTPTPSVTPKPTVTPTPTTSGEPTPIKRNNIAWIVLGIFVFIVTSIGIYSYVTRDEIPLPPYIDDNGNVDWDQKYELDRQ